MPWMKCAVDDALEVRVDQHFGNSLSEDKHVFHRERAFFPNDLLKTGPVEKFHEHNRRVIIFLNLEDFNEVGMIEFQEGFGFFYEVFSAN